MDKQDFADTLNNVKDLTLGQLFRLIARLKYKTVAMILIFIMSTLGSAFVAGKYSQQKDTAVMLESPFAMRLEVEGHQYDFDNLTLMLDPTMPKLSDNQVILSLREIKSPFDVIPVGKVIATIEEHKISGIWKLIISKADILSVAYAGPIPVFSWNGHDRDYSFKEQFVDEDTVYRYYSDECILAYEVDANRRSRPETFRWIKNTHAGNSHE